MNTTERLDTIGKRLRSAIEQRPSRGRKRGVRLFQADLEKHAEVEHLKIATTLPTIYAYLNDEALPSLQFLREAARVLRVREVWLTYGAGLPTQEEADLRAEQEKADPVYAPLIEAFDETFGPLAWDGLAIAARGQLVRLWQRIFELRFTEDLTDEEGAQLHSRCARQVCEAVRAPLDVLHIEPTAEAFHSYVVTTCESLLQSASNPFWTHILPLPEED